MAVWESATVRISGTSFGNVVYTLQPAARIFSQSPLLTLLTLLSLVSQSPGFILLRDQTTGLISFLPPDESGRLMQVWG